MDDDECENCGHIFSEHKTDYCKGDGKEDGEWVCDCSIEDFEVTVEG